MKFSAGAAFAAFSASLLAVGTQAQSVFSPAKPPAVPLGVKSPYLSTWLQAGSGNSGNLAGEWPTFWAGQTTGWAGIIRVDGTAYTWMGNPANAGNPVTQTEFSYTSTRSVFASTAGGVELNVTFLSPIYPEDQKRGSLVFTYLDVSVQSADGKPHTVELYADISAEWVTGDHSAIAQWDYSTNGDVASHKVWRQEQLPFSETNQQADWGNWYWSTTNAKSLTYQSGADVDIRGAFVSNGKLGNSQDTNFRAINQDWPVFGFASDLGSVTFPVSTTYSLGLAQEQAIQFDGATGIIPLNSLWTSYWSSDADAVSFVQNDYHNAVAAGDAFDTKVATDAVAAGGQDYLTITSLSARQAFGTVQLVGNLTKQYLFLKEISSDGNAQTVDVIFPFHPILVYANPSLLKLLLDPLFENQESGQYPNKYSMHDLGSSYPNATGHPDGKDEQQPLEECGNMLIMTLAYAQQVNDVSYLTKHYNLLKQWTQYLVEEALIPANQISTDDFAGSLANQTNLALKGIIGIGAFAEVAKLTGNTDDASNYTSIAKSYIDQWQTLGIAHDASPPHTTLGYGLNDTHGLLYNLYGDTELQLGLVPQSVYDMQSTFYPTVADEFGVPLDTRHNYTKSDWQMFSAAIADSKTQSLLISLVAKYIGQTATNLALSDWYDAQTAGWPVDGGVFTARPVVGGHFALLALNAIKARKLQA